MDDFLRDDTQRGDKEKINKRLLGAIKDFPKPIITDSFGMNVFCTTAIKIWKRACVFASQSAEMFSQIKGKTRKDRKKMLEWTVK